MEIIITVEDYKNLIEGICGEDCADSEIRKTEHMKNIERKIGKVYPGGVRINCIQRENYS